MKPEIPRLINESESAYSLVIAIAKRSREIAEQAIEDKVILQDKPVNIAIDEFGAHKLRVVESSEVCAQPEETEATESAQDPAEE